MFHSRTCFRLLHIPMGNYFKNSYHVLPSDYTQMLYRPIAHIENNPHFSFLINRQFYFNMLMLNVNSILKGCSSSDKKHVPFVKFNGSCASSVHVLRLLFDSLCWAFDKQATCPGCTT